MDTREFKGLELAVRAKIEQRNTYFYVPSASHEGGYKVNNDATECSCPDYEERQLPCKHCHAVKIVKERNRGTPIPDQKEVCPTRSEADVSPIVAAIQQSPMPREGTVPSVARGTLPRDRVDGERRHGPSFPPIRCRDLRRDLQGLQHA